MQLNRRPNEAWLTDELIEGSLRLCVRAQAESPDRSTQIGAVLYSSTGYFIASSCNDFPKGIRLLPERLERPIKYTYTEHAERNAIFAAARLGASTHGGTLFMVGMGPPTVPCVECARAIIQAGIVRVIGKAYKEVPDYWADQFVVSKQMLEEADVEFIEWS